VPFAETHLYPVLLGGVRGVSVAVVALHTTPSCFT
jgi:hypothetical protein